MNGVHSTRTAPAISGTLDLDGTELETDLSRAPNGSIRAFRAASRGRPAPDVLNMDDNPDQRADEHAKRGVPDPRRGRTTVLTDDELATTPTVYSNTRRAVVIDPEAPPARARQGWTGADPTRLAQLVRPFMLRKFDQNAAQHPGELTKVESPSPLAAGPRTGLSDIKGQPYAGGSTGTQRAGIGPTPNSFRIMPQAWDELLVNVGGPAVSASNPDPALTAARAQTNGRSFRR